MAILVQRLVRAEAAGVAFTANPVTGDRSEVVINSVKGLGERLVSGTSTPDEWVVKGGNASCVASVEDAINAKLALEIADLGRRVEAHVGSPQDVEWAFSDGKLYLIQARPITSHVIGKKEQVVPVPITIEAPEGFWQREEASFAHPVSPMEISLWNPFMREMSQRYSSEFGLPFDGMEFRSIGGYVYLRLIPLGGKERSPPPSWLMPFLVRLVPQIRAMNKKCVQAVRANRQEQVIDSWYNESRPSIKKRIHDLLDMDLSSLNDDDLRKQIDAAVNLYYEASEVHFRLVFSISLPMGRFFAFCRSYLRWSDSKIVVMLSGLNEVSVEPSRGLTELAEAAAGNAALMKLLATKGDEEILGNLEKVDPAFANALSDYIEQYGHRALSYEVSAPTMAEDPAIIISLIQQRARVGRSSAYLSSVEAVTKRREDTIAEARKILDARSAIEREKFEQLLKGAERAHPTLEDSEFYSMECRGLVRDRLLELGRRVAKSALVDSPEDIFFFGIDEVKDILQVKPTEDLRALAKKRKGEHAWAEEHAGPKSYGKQPRPPPDMKGFPPEVREVIESLLWQTNNFMPSTQNQEKSDTLSGIAASPGKYTGPVRVIMDESEFSKLRPGDVLVCPLTNPSWSILFPDIGALVTDAGGILSHPAIIAREYRVPAVVATSNGTKLMHNGDIVTVDGDAGIVKLEATASGSR